MGESSSANDLYFHYDGNGEIAGFEKYEGAGHFSYYYYLKNLQGDVIGILDSSGNLVVEYTYDAWGKVESVTGSKANTIGALNPIRYRGYYYDTDLNMYYLQSRYYDPEMGRFISSDDAAMSMNALEDITAANLFAYCGNDPVNNLDSSGYYKIKNFNCYAYAMGINNKWLLPGGKFAMPRYYTVEQIVKWVLQDFKATKIRKLAGKNSKLKFGEYRIAARVSNYSSVLPYWKWIRQNCYLFTYDFHFWKQNPENGVWWSKSGADPIKRLGKINPDNTNNWFIFNDNYYSLVRNIYGCTFKSRSIYYNSKTVYFAVKGEFWAK